MKDIDFDELDRAVSSLMGSVPKEGDKKDTNESATPAQEPSVQSSAEVNLAPAGAQLESPVVPEASVLDEPQVTETAASDSATTADSAPSNQPEPSSTPPVRRGRFMDVKPTGGRDSARPAPSRPVSRQAPALQPVGGEAEFPPEQTSASEPAFDQPSSADQPDPISFQPAATTGSEVEDSELLASAKDQVDSILGDEPQASTEEVAGYSEPLDSPFLPGAKVEKRPLGRPAEAAAPVVDLASELAEGGDTTPASEATQDVSDNISPNKDAQLPGQPLPPELSSDVLSIETDSGTVADLAAASAETSPEASKPQPEVQPTAQPAPPAPPAPAPVAASRPAAVSIPQQYRVEPKKSEEPQSTSTIYDAQPLSHPAKKTPGWVWVVAITVIIILGVAGGVAVYYLGMN